MLSLKEHIRGEHIFKALKKLHTGLQVSFL